MNNVLDRHPCHFQTELADFLGKQFVIKHHLSEGRLESSKPAPAVTGYTEVWFLLTSKWTSCLLQVCGFTSSIVKLISSKN
jgi:hypothetical protein